ncbi:MAG TPA: hypothetical protein VFA06_07370 [Actinocrinis sp.]|uniref:hypothetical protein n=1 Tax=Actinocrinis sp. TaxID=1920516 RepID=UPI002D3B7489|nr:hypothetical protein [Actinocrinis sp.]HZU55673.1 hypothetical protein [Actinocrinis sp.]
MTVVVNLKDVALKPTACGSCQGSSSDNTVRTEVRTALEEQARTGQTVNETSALIAA